MNKTYKPEDIGVELTPENLKEIFDAQRSGCFACLRNYVNKHGEIATHWFQVGVDYGRVISRSVALIDSWLMAGAIAKVQTVEVHYRTWIGSDGLEYNREAKGRVAMDRHLTLDASDERIIKALREIRAELLTPKEDKQKGADYHREAKGLFSLDRADGEQKLYIRDCLTVGKEVHVRGEYEDKKTTGDKAIRDAVRRLLPVGRYRQYIIEGRFDAFTVGGVSLMADDAGRVFETLPELSRQVELNPEASAIVQSAEPEEIEEVLVEAPRA